MLKAKFVTTVLKTDLINNSELLRTNRVLEMNIKQVTIENDQIKSADSIFKSRNKELNKMLDDANSQRKLAINEFNELKNQLVVFISKIN